MARLDPHNPMVLMERQRLGQDHLLSIPGWPRIELRHATRGNRQPGTAHRACHTHAVYHVVLITEGEGSFLIDDQTVPVTAPMVFCCSPWQPHSFSRLPHDSTVYSEVTFEAGEAQNPGTWSDLLHLWTGQSCVVPVGMKLNREEASNMAHLIAMIADPVLAEHPQADVVARGYVHHVWMLLWQRCLIIHPPTAPDPLELARQRLESQTQDALSLTDVAREAGLSAKHFGRAFRQRFGVPPMHYHRTYSLRRASVLLRTTALPLKAIATACGFADPHYFHRAFRQAFATTPTAYRQQAGTVPAESDT